MPKELHLTAQAAGSIPVPMVATLSVAQWQSSVNVSSSFVAAFFE
jgi:hypothetical protein